MVRIRRKGTQLFGDSAYFTSSVKTATTVKPKDPVWIDLRVKLNPLGLAQSLQQPFSSLGGTR
jgi:hypothetical protein